MPAPPEGFSSGASATTQLDMLSWNQVVLYIADRHTDNIPVIASLKLPAGWHYGTALPVAGESGGQINFEQVSLTTLVDSPVLAGAHFRRIPLTPEGPIQHYIDEVSDGNAALQMPPETIDAVQAPGCRNRSALRRAALSRLPFPAHLERPHGALRAGAS